MRRALTQTQAAELLRAASVLPPASRDAFLRAVDGHLVGIRRQLTDDDVNAAIVTVLGDASITTTSHFMCDAAPQQEANMTRQSDDDDDAFDERGLLRDGKRARVSIMMRDAAMARDAVARRGFDDSQARHSVGPVFTDAAGLERKAEAYRQMCDDLQNAWRTPAADDAADRRRKRKGMSRDPFGRETGSWEETEEDDAAIIVYRGEQAGDVCTVREGGVAEGSPGHLRMVGGKLTCVPDRQDAAPAVPRTIDAAAARRIKQEAYERMCQEDRDAWKTPLP